MGKPLVAVAVLLALQAEMRPARVEFASTMRVDYVHSGGPGGESFRLDRVLDDGEWPGSRTKLVDDVRLGKYFVEVVDSSTGDAVYSRGFASLYGEWETTPEVRARDRSFHESVRFPWPTTPVRLVVSKRDGAGAFQPVWNLAIDPSTVPRKAAAAPGRVTPFLRSGPSASKVDVALISEGYSADQLTRFREDVARLVNSLFTLEPFRSRRSAFNVWMVEAPDTSLHVEFNIFGIERYALTYDNRTLRDVAASAQYDVIQIVVNEQKYGGGGIFNQQSAVAAASSGADYVFIHEFAHNLAGLGDEYIGNVTYETGSAIKIEPWEPNVTALLDPAKLKWADLVEPGTPIPTPIGLAGKVGAFEGAGYEAKGLYRPEAECIMGVRKVIPFCKVCRRAIDVAIDSHVR